MLHIFKRVMTLRVPIHAACAAGSIAWFQWAKTNLDLSYAASQHPVDYMTGQTSFSGEAIKGYYAVMSEAGTLPIYTKTQLIDFTFIMGFLAIGLFLCTLIARLNRHDSFGRKVGITAGVSFTLGGLCDMIENGWSFVMLANPTNFADWLALPYSAFAVMKFFFITVGMGLTLACIATALIGRALRGPKIG